MKSNLLTRTPSTEVLKLAATQPFVDQATTHTFSDWLLVCCYDFGYDPDDEEFEPGALPEIDLKNLSQRTLLPLGELLQDKMSGRHFFDLGCGDPKISVVPRILAETFNAKRYLGVDLFHVKDSEDYTKMDLLEYLTRLELKAPKVFYFGGVDPKNNNCTDYLYAVRGELVRLCLPEDLIILGAGSTGFGFEEMPNKFGAIYSDALHEVIEVR